MNSEAVVFSQNAISALTVGIVTILLFKLLVSESTYFLSDTFQMLFMSPYSRGSQTVGHPPGGAVGPLRGASCLYEGLIYFERNMDARQKNIFL
jgi:hypothetical protein